MRETKLYSPSNGTEFDWFQSKWCEQCKKQSNDTAYCSIETKAMFNDIGDDDYPNEWRYENGQPICTGFVHKLDDRPQPLPRCRETPDLFLMRGACK